jgi:hypothetical protein
MAQITASPLPQSVARGPQGGLGAMPIYALLERFGYALFIVTVACIGIAYPEPSPYDVGAIAMIALWLVLGLRVPRGAVLFLGLLVVHHVSLFIALVPHLHDADSVRWTLLSGYLMVTAIFFVLFFSDDTQRRVEMALKAFVAGCVVAAAAAIMGYFDAVPPARSRTRTFSALS